MEPRLPTYFGRLGLLRPLEQVSASREASWLSPQTRWVLFQWWRAECCVPLARLHCCPILLPYPPPRAGVRRKRENKKANELWYRSGAKVDIFNFECSEFAGSATGPITQLYKCFIALSFADSDQLDDPRLTDDVWGFPMPYAYPDQARGGIAMKPWLESRNVLLPRQSARFQRGK
jgi:hypothetical protein